MGSVKLIPEKDLEVFIDITNAAFPRSGSNSPEERQRSLSHFKAIETDPLRSLYGYYRKDQLLGGMILHDFTMNYHGQLMLVGGIGLVVVSLLHKKEKVAKDMLTFFLQLYHSKQAPLVALYPFRPDFYKRMGFGYGTKINQYRIEPSALPRSDLKNHIRYLTAEDSKEVLDCYDRYARNTHGMILGSDRVIESYFSNPDRYVIGYVQDRLVSGYILFSFDEKQEFSLNELVIHEFVYETRASMAELLNFMYTQLDQVNRIVFNTHDESFHFLLGDPRSDSHHIIPHVYHETNTQGVGLMYRVLDVGSLFSAAKNHNFGGQSAKLMITIVDTFLPEKAGSTIVHFERGRAILNRVDYDIVIEMDISDFSSLVMGAVDFEKLYYFNRAKISDETYIELISQIFQCKTPPVCMTRF